MKIVFVGGGTGGHFYPLIAVAEGIDTYAQENQLVQPRKYYFGPVHYDERALYNVGMTYVYCSAGKIRRTKDIGSKIRNFFALFPITLGILKALLNLFIIYPDVVFSKGGYTSFPVLFAARMLRIPVVIHESDAAFGRVGKWSASFAAYIAIAYPEAEKQLSEKQKKRTALIGIPMRRQLRRNPMDDVHKQLKLNPDVPTIFVLGGSSGAQYVNENIIDALPKLLEHYQVIHQTGKNNIERIQKEMESFLNIMNQERHEYRPVGFLDAYQMRLAYSAADVVVTRAGSGTLFEIAEWGIPSIIIPIREEVSHDQRKNAYAYARSAGGIVIEEQNLSPNLLVAQIEKILRDKNLRENMKQQAASFATPDAAKKAAKLLVDILKSHET